MKPCVPIGPSSRRGASLDYLLLLTAVLCIQHSSCRASCHLQLQRNFTLNESPPLVRVPVVQLNSPGCGRHVKFSATKSGSPVARRYLPWMVLLVTRTLSGVYRYCSGTIITERHVLTAGHCTFYTKEDPISSIKVYYGMKGLKGPYKRASRFLRHPGFDISTLRNDISILMLDFDSELRYQNTVEDIVKRLRKILSAAATLASLAQPSCTGVDTFLRRRLSKIARISGVPPGDIIGPCVIWDDLKRLVCCKEPREIMKLQRKEALVLYFCVYYAKDVTYPAAFGLLLGFVQAVVI